MKTVEQNKSGPVYSKKVVQVGANRLWWKRFVEKVSFEPGMKEIRLDTCLTWLTTSNALIQSSRECQLIDWHELIVPQYNTLCGRSPLARALTENYWTGSAGSRHIPSRSTYERVPMLLWIEATAHFPCTKSRRSWSGHRLSELLSGIQCLHQHINTL